MSEDPVNTYTASSAPVLRLRTTTENQRIEKEKLDLRKLPDGPWRRHPDEIEEDICTLADADFPLDISVEKYRVYFQERMAAFTKYMRQLSSRDRDDHITVRYTSTIGQLMDPKHMLEMSETEIEDSSEGQFVHCGVYVVERSKELCLPSP
jgi:hypothetical protein